MKSTFFIAPTQYQKDLKLECPFTLRELCELAGVRCKATGAFTDRKVELAEGEEIRVLAEPGDWGRVKIFLKTGSKKSMAMQALIVMAYGLHDLVAKESIRGESWVKLKAPVGRPKCTKPLLNKERQRRFRDKLRSTKPRYAAKSV